MMRLISSGRQQCGQVGGKVRCTPRRDRDKSNCVKTNWNLCVFLTAANSNTWWLSEETVSTYSVTHWTLITWPRSRRSMAPVEVGCGPSCYPTSVASGQIAFTHCSSSWPYSQLLHVVAAALSYFLTLEPISLVSYWPQNLCGRKFWDMQLWFS